MKMRPLIPAGSIAGAFAALLLIMTVGGGTSAEAQKGVPANSAREMTVHYIDVDQGAAELLEFPCGAVLIDAGGRGAAASRHLVAYLDAFFQRRRDLRGPDGRGRLAAVYVTHAHFDHDMNLRRVAERFRVGAFIFNGKVNARTTWMINRGNSASTRFPVVAISGPNDPVTGAEPAPRVEVVAAGPGTSSDSRVDPLRCPGVDPVIRILSGGQSDERGEFDNPNNHSLVIRVDYDQASFLFTGDLETPAIDRLIRRYSGTRLLDVDVFQVGHHGAENGTTRPFMREMSPEIAVISVGQPNTRRIPMSAWDHGHPREDMMDLLEDFITRPRSAVDIMTFDRQEGVPAAHRESRAIYATSRDGDVRVVASPNGTFQVRTSR